MAAFNSLLYLVYSIATLASNNKPTTDPTQSAWEVSSESLATETWNQEHYVTSNYDAEKCPPGEEWSDCDAGCETTCETVGQPQICPRMCVPGCVCAQPGEVRGPNKQCIAPPLCPKKKNDEEKCPPGEEWSDCDAGCETTCETVGQPQICPRMCVPGCVCAQPGEVRGPDKQCIAPPLCPKEEKKTCDDKPETGLCRGYFPMWYYDDSSSDCKQFIYGGCGGNGNRYKTKEECLRNCANIWPDSDVRKTDVDRCAQPAETGLCQGHFPRYYFDKDAGQCKKFVYGGCGGNENNFKTEEECQQACGSKVDDAEKCPAGEKWSECNGGCETTCETVGQPLICPRICIPGCLCARRGEVRGPNKQCIASRSCPKKEKKTCDDKPETGLCRGYFPMWYYDDSSSDCKKFIYGGCGGNGNKYKTKEECLRNCANIWPDSDVRKTEVDRCAQPAETGLCDGHFPRYYFDKEAGQCKKFVYGGCGGNENNFKTEEECQQACRKQHTSRDDCPANKEWGSYGDCPDSCWSLKHPVRPCTMKVNHGCKCKSGYVLREDKVYTSDCIKPEECP